MEELTTFIGVKIVKANPMTAGVFNSIKPNGNCKDRDPSDEGYYIEYPQGDGYVSWCPKAVFEENNRPTKGMTFGMATEAMLKGEKVMRSGWNGSGMHLSVQSPDSGSKMTHPYFYMTIPDCDEGTRLLPWQPAQVDCFATDWSVID